MSKIHHRNVFPSGNFHEMPRIGVPPRRRVITVDRAACVAIGVFAGAVLELLAR